MKYFLIAILFLVNFFFPIANAQVISAIEIGSKGIKGIAYDLGKLEEELPKKIYSANAITDLMLGEKDGYLQEDRIKASAQAVKVMFEELKQKDPVFFVIAASTAFDKIKNRTILQNAIKEATGKDLQFISSDEEMNYGLRAAVPQKYIYESILIDIGGGNTKIGYVTPMSANGFESFTIPYGSVKLTDMAASLNGEFITSLNKIASSSLRDAIKQGMIGRYGLTNPARRIYIQGGASWAVANFAKPELILKRNVLLNYNDISKVNNNFESGVFSINSTNDSANKEIFSIMEKFSPNQLQSGSRILKTVISELGGNTRLIIFPRNEGWIAGYLFANFNSSRSN
jgi:Ppx/GppA phosphatase family